MLPFAPKKCHFEFDAKVSATTSESVTSTTTGPTATTTGEETTTVMDMIMPTTVVPDQTVAANTQPTTDDVRETTTATRSEEDTTLTFYSDMFITADDESEIPALSRLGDVPLPPDEPGTEESPEELDNKLSDIFADVPDLDEFENIMGQLLPEAAVSIANSLSDDGQRKEDDILEFELVEEEEENEDSAAEESEEVEPSSANDVEAEYTGEPV